MESSQIHLFYEWLNPLAKRDSIEFDFHGFHQEGTKVLFQKQELKNFSYSEENHLDLRVLKGEKTGFSYTRDFSRTSLEDCYRRAVDSLELSDKKERGRLSLDQKYKDFSPFYDPNIETLSLEEKIKKTQDMNKACIDFNKKIQPVYSSVADFSFYRFFSNSEKIQSSYRTNFVSVVCSALAISEDSRSEFWNEIASRNYQSLDFVKIGRESADKAIKKLKYSIPKTKKYPVIFQSGQASASLLYRLGELLNGKSVFEGLSLFKDSLKKKIFSDSVSFYDDPFALWGFDSKPFDGEGFATEKTPLVEEGVLENYLTNSFFAKALKVSHTKKASWKDSGSLSVSATNLVMLEGKSAFKELLEEFPQVFVIDCLKGFAGYNSISGNFSIESEGFLWEKGEARPFCQFTVSGNIRDIFANILKVGQDSQIYNGFIKSPSFLVPDLMIAGK